MLTFLQNLNEILWSFPLLFLLLFTHIFFTLHSHGVQKNIFRAIKLSDEKLKYMKEPLSSVRLVNGMVERLLFTETEDGIEVELLEIDSTHYGNKK